VTETHIYAVGVLRQLHRIRAALDPRRPGPLHTRFTRRTAPTGWRRDTIRHALRCIRDDAHRRSAWNGYLAEPTTDGIYWTRCGHGWTKRRATASLLRHIGEVQASGHLRYEYAR
jgi:hypothetical protein